MSGLQSYKMKCTDFFVVVAFMALKIQFLSKNIAVKSTQFDFKLYVYDSVEFVLIHIQPALKKKRC